MTPKEHTKKSTLPHRWKLLLKFLLVNFINCTKSSQPDQVISNSDQCDDDLYPIATGIIEYEVTYSILEHQYRFPILATRHTFHHSAAGGEVLIS